MGKTRRHTHKKSKAHRHTKKCIGRKHRNHTKKMSGGVGIRTYFRKRGERKAAEKQKKAEEKAEKKRKEEIEKAAEAKGPTNYKPEFPNRPKSPTHEYNVLAPREEAIYAEARPASYMSIKSLKPASYASIKSRKPASYANASIRSGSYANDTPKLKSKSPSYAIARNYPNEDRYARVEKNLGKRSRTRILVQGASPSNTKLETDF